MDPTAVNQAAQSAPAAQSIASQLMLLMLLLALIAVCVGAVVFFLQRYLNPEPSAVELRLQKLRGDVPNKEVVQESEETRKIKSYLESEYKNPALGKFLEQYDFFLNLKKLMQQAEETKPPDQYFIMFMVIPAVFFVITGLLIGFPQVILFSILVPVGLVFSLKMKKNKRLGMFTAQFPDALGMMCSSLRAGHAFQSTLTVVSTELAPPMSTEFSAVVKDINLGIPVTDALDRLLYKLDYLPDVQMFCTAVSIQREAGGNLAEVLDKLGYTIRERFKLKGQISALTGQSRLTGYVLGLAPIGLLIGLSVFFYDYVRPLYEQQIGQIALIASAIGMTIGFFLIQKIVDIRV